MRRSRDVGHQNGPFSALRASSISVGNLAAHDMINRNVIKCHHSYGQLPSSALWHPTKTLPMWRNVGESDTLAAAVIRTSSFIVHPSSFPSTWGFPATAHLTISPYQQNHR
jgi:hypothetical protein